MHIVEPARALRNDICLAHGAIARQRRTLRALGHVAHIAASTSYIRGSADQLRKEMDALGPIQWNRRCDHSPECREHEISMLIAALKACSSTRDLRRAKIIHAAAIEQGCDSDMYVANSLISVYGKCGRVDQARSIFDGMRQRSVVTWTALIMGYADNGEGKVALDLYTCMGLEGCKPNAVTFVAALKACRNIGNNVVMVYAIHAQASDAGCLSDAVIANTLVDNYVKCRRLVCARRVFDDMPLRGVVTWTTLVLGYAENGEEELALRLFLLMGKDGCLADDVAFMAALKASHNLAMRESAVRIGGKLVKRESLGIAFALHAAASSWSRPLLATTLLATYAKCGDVSSATRVFDTIASRDVASWNALLAGNAENGEGRNAIQLFVKMRLEGCVPDVPTFLAALKACAQLGNPRIEKEQLEIGRALHRQAWIGGCCNANVEVSTSLLSMYASCGEMEEAARVLREMARRDAIAWNALLSGYVENRQGRIALHCIAEMQIDGCSPNVQTYVAALKSCTLLAALDEGRAIHVALLCHAADSIACVAPTLVDFYAKCGKIGDARRVFDERVHRDDTVAWNAMLAGYCRSGDVAAAFALFGDMCRERVRPSSVTFLCLLTACSHAGLIDKGKELLETMSTRYAISPDVEHYTCVVDMLARTGDWDAAVAVVTRMPFHPDTVTWNALLGACKDAEQGKNVLQRSGLDDGDATPYVLIANAYSGIQIHTLPLHKCVSDS